MAIAMLSPASPLQLPVGLCNCGGAGAEADATCSPLLGCASYGATVSGRKRPSKHEYDVVRLRLGAWRHNIAAAKSLLAKRPKILTRNREMAQGIVRAEAQPEDSFEDVDKHLLDYFTYKAVRTVLVQLHEMNPAQYAWLYNFVVANKPQDSKSFLRVLVKERLELGERVMVTRLHLFGKWVLKYNHANMHKAITDQNLELLREHLRKTIKFTTDEDVGRPPLKST